jgi:hypothetical protein
MRTVAGSMPRMIFAIRTLRLVCLGSPPDRERGADGMFGALLQELGDGCWASESD